MLVSSRDVGIRPLATRMLGLIQVNYAAVCRRLADVVVAGEKENGNVQPMPSAQMHPRRYRTLAR